MFPRKYPICLFKSNNFTNRTNNYYTFFKSKFSFVHYSIDVKILTHLYFVKYGFARNTPNILSRTPNSKLKFSNIIIKSNLFVDSDDSIKNMIKSYLPPKTFSSLIQLCSVKQYASFGLLKTQSYSSGKEFGKLPQGRTRENDKEEKQKRRSL